VLLLLLSLVALQLSVSLFVGVPLCIPGRADATIPDDADPLSLRSVRRIWLNGRAATAPFGQSTEGMTKSVMALQERGLS
jgi:hypothetical protein